MRMFSFVLFVLCFCAGPASSWTEYNYLDQGVAIQFPGKPEAKRSTYDSIYGKALSSMVYTAEEDHVRYSLTVVDLAGGPDPGPAPSPQGVARSAQANAGCVPSH